MLLFFIILIIISSFLIHYLDFNNLKGKSGEKLVAERLEIIDGHKHIINNIMINDNGKSRQIDHIAITKYGVFIIETKNFNGDIYGKETSDTWRQYINNKCFKFKNPIHQNYGHLEIVKRHIGDITTDIYSVVTFIRRCRLHVDTVTPVVYEDQLAMFIKSKKIVLSEEKIDEIYKVITDNQITDKNIIKDHKENVQKYVEYKNKLVENEICPRCYGKLIKRNGKNGQFYGCSNYPKCRYTKNIDNIKYYESLEKE